MVIGASVFGYVVANVSNLIGNSNFIEKKTIRKISLIKEFLNSSKCSKIISNDVIGHFRQSAKLNSNFDQKEMFGRLPMRMKNEMLLMGQMDVIVNIPIFHYIKNVSIKLYLLEIMVAHVAATGRSIIREGDIGTKILFLVGGNASVFKAVTEGKSKNNNDNNDNSNNNNNDNMDGKKRNGKTRAKYLQDKNKNKVIQQFQMTLQLLRAGKEKEKENLKKSLTNNISARMSRKGKERFPAQNIPMEVNKI